MRDRDRLVLVFLSNHTNNYKYTRFIKQRPDQFITTDEGRVFITEKFYNDVNKLDSLRLKDEDPLLKVFHRIMGDEHYNEILGMSYLKKRFSWDELEKVYELAHAVGLHSVTVPLTFVSVYCKKQKYLIKRTQSY